LTSKRLLDIEGRKYALFPMPPMNSVYYGPKVVQSLSQCISGVDLAAVVAAAESSESKAESLGMELLKMLPNLDAKVFSDLMMEAMQFEVSCPSGKLSVESIFNQWFTDHPGDLFPVGIWAIWEHSKDYWLKSGAGFQSVLGVGLPSESPKTGKQTT